MRKNEQPCSPPLSAVPPESLLRAAQITGARGQIRKFWVNLYKEYSYLRLNELKELSCFWVMIWQPSQLLWSALLYLLITLYVQK